MMRRGIINWIKTIYSFIIGNRTITSGWSGVYDTWDLALNDSASYGQDEILEKVKVSLLAVKEKRAIAERDSFLLSRKEYSWPLLCGILLSARGPNLRVIDFGGSLGSTYFQMRDLIKNYSLVKWTVIEQESFVKVGKSHFEDHELNFAFTLDEALAQMNYDTIVFSSVLQYIEHPYELINEAKQYGIPYILIDRTAFVNAEVEQIKKQVVPPEIYSASYPCRFFNEEKFIQAFTDEYELLADFNSYCDDSVISDTDHRLYWKGFIFRKK